MFDLQYDLCAQVDQVIREHVANLPGVVEAMAISYVIEHLAERARFNVDLPKLPWRAPSVPSPTTREPE